METYTIDVTQGQYATAKDARNAGRIPMIYYGKGSENVNVSVDYQDFRRTYEKAGKSAIINLKNEEGKEIPVLVHEIQYHPVSDEMIHIDLMVVNLNKVIHTEIPLTFVGDAPAIRELAGMFMNNKDVVNVECLPKDLPHEIEVDISSLVDFNCSITVADVKAPEGVTILDADDINIATVTAPREEEEEAPVEAVAVEGEEGEEGEEGGEEKKEEGGEA